MANQKALIVGSGIGGLTAALCLADSGFDVEVFEQAEEIGEVGAGIQLSPNCSRVLHYLGLEAVLQATAFLPEVAEIRDWKSGKLLSSTPLGDTAVEQYGAPYYHIHRADLISGLYEMAKINPRIQVHIGARIERFDAPLNGVVINCNGKDVRGDMLIGADGIRSVIRSELFGDQESRFTGNVAWRGLVSAEKMPNGMIPPVAGLWWGPRKHFVHYYVRGGDLINFVCVVEKSGWEVESWNEQGNLQELKKDFEGWDESIGLLIDAMDPNECFKWALFDHAPMPSWGRGRISLLGDACHATLPFLAQGAAMAIEDAVVLAACVEVEGIEPGLRKYETLRMPRTARIQDASRRNSRIFHMSGVKSWARNGLAGLAVDNVLDWVYRYNAFDIPD